MILWGYQVQFVASTMICVDDVRRLIFVANMAFCLLECCISELF